MGYYFLYKIYMGNYILILNQNLHVCWVYFFIFTFVFHDILAARNILLILSFWLLMWFVKHSFHYHVICYNLSNRNDHISDPTSIQLLFEIAQTLHDNIEFMNVKDNDGQVARSISRFVLMVTRSFWYYLGLLSLSLVVLIFIFFSWLISWLLTASIY